MCELRIRLALRPGCGQGPAAGEIPGESGRKQALVPEERLRGSEPGCGAGGQKCGVRAATCLLRSARKACRLPPACLFALEVGAEVRGP